MVEQKSATHFGCGGGIVHIENVWQRYEVFENGDFGEMLKDWPGDDSNYQCVQCDTEAYSLEDLTEQQSDDNG